MKNDEHGIPNIISTLIEIANADVGNAPINLSDVIAAAQMALTEALGVISTAHFSSAALLMLRSNHLKVSLQCVPRVVTNVYAY